MTGVVSWAGTSHPQGRPGATTWALPAPTTELSSS